MTKGNVPAKFSLQGKTAVITGAAGLLGIEHASALLECGAVVVLTDIDHFSLKETGHYLEKEFEPSRVQCFSMDVTSRQSINDVLSELKNSEQRVDILVNNAAVDPKVDPQLEIPQSSRLESFPLAEWNSQLAVGLTGAFLCSQIFGSEMARDKSGGVIVNIASDLSVISPDQRIYHREGVAEELQSVKPVTYSVIKAGLVGLTRYLSTYWSDCGVRANALSPGGIYSGQDEKFVRRLESLIPLGRMAEKAEYRSIMQFLCSDASSYLNGQNIVMDGGRSVW